MTGASILPVAWHKGKLYFLFGRDIGDTPGYACFGGGIDKKDRDVFKAALRECAEEMSGFLGNADQLYEMIKTNGGKMEFSHYTGQSMYHGHIIRVPYEPLLPYFYNHSHQYLIKRMKCQSPNKHLFEKAELTWMTVEDMKNRRSEFREFYREIVDQLLSIIPSITKFVKSGPRPSFSTSGSASTSSAISKRNKQAAKKTRKHRPTRK
jgi:8-oxo-dGTP pyrophosphatase MutT (NUDIX family)